MNKRHDDLNTFVANFATAYAARNKRYRVERDDLIQEGMIALWEAERSYTGPEEGFDKYAKSCVRHAFYHYVYKMSVGRPYGGAEKYSGWNDDQQVVASLDEIVDGIDGETNGNLRVEEDEVFGQSISCHDFLSMLSEDEKTILAHRITNGCADASRFIDHSSMSKYKYYVNLCSLRNKAIDYFGRW